MAVEVVHVEPACLLLSSRTNQMPGPLSRDRVLPIKAGCTWDRGSLSSCHRSNQPEMHIGSESKTILIIVSIEMRLEIYVESSDLHLS